MMNTLRRFFLHWQNWLGFFILLAFLEVAAAAPWLAPAPAPPARPPTLEERMLENRLGRQPQPPNEQYLLGTLTQSRDVWHDIIWGTRQALDFSLKAGLISALIGVLLGTLAAYLGGWANEGIMRLSDGLLALPVIAAVVMFSMAQQVALSGLPNGGRVLVGGGRWVFGPEASAILAFDTTLWAIILLAWIPYARITNALVIELKSTEFVQAARSLGASPAHIIFRHLIPNASSPAVVLLARDMGWLVILQASLNFAGFGSTSVWGQQLLLGRNWIIGLHGNPFQFWWVWVPGTLVIILYGLGWNLIGDGLNDALNPRQAVKR